MNRKRIRWTTLIVGGGVCLLMVTVGWFRLQSFAYKHLRAAVMAQLTRAWDRDVQIASIVRKVNGSFVLRNIVVAGNIDEPPLLTAPEATAWVDLWELIAHRKVVVRSLALRDPQLFLRTTTTTVTSFDHVSALDQLATTGLQNVSLRGGQVTYAYSSTSEPATVVHITGLNGDAEVSPKRYHLSLKAAHAHTDTIYLSSLSVDGSREGNVVTIDRSKAVYEGSPVTASGTYKLDSGVTRMKVTGSIPLSRLAAPQDGKFRGTADVNLTFLADSRVWQEAAGSLTVKGAQWVPPKGDPIVIESASGRVRATPAQIDITGLAMKLDGTRIEGALTVNAAPASIGIGTPYAFKGTVTSSEWKRHLLAGVAIPVNGGELAVRVNVKSTFPKLPETLDGQIRLTDARLLRPGGGPATLDRAESTFAWRHDALKLTNLEIAGDGLRFRGGLTLHARPLAVRADSPYVVQGSLTVDDSAHLRKWLPGIPVSAKNGRLAMSLVMKDQLPHAARNLRGTFLLTNAQIAGVRNGEPVRVNSAAGTFSSDGSKLAIRNVSVKMQDVTMKGSLALNAPLTSIGNGTPYRLEGRLDATNAERLRRLFPGLPVGMEQGRLALRVMMQDRLPHVTRSMRGQFFLTDARLGLPGQSKHSVKSASGAFLAQPRGLTMRDLSVRTESFAVDGHVTLKDSPLAIGKGTPYAFQGTISAWDWKAIAKLFPDLPKSIKSGKLLIKVALNDRLPNVPTSLRGRFALTDAHIQMSPAKPELISIKRANGAFARSNEELTIADASAELGDIKAKGSVTVTGLGARQKAQYRLAGVVTGANIASTAAQIGQATLAENLVGGAFTVQARANGDVASGLENLRGTLSVRNARLSSPPLRVQTLSSGFQQKGDKIELTGLRIITPQFSGNGTASVAGNRDFALQATLIVSRLASLGSLHPALASFAGGRGVVQVKGQGRADNVENSTWTGTFKGEDGSWKLAQALWGMTKLDFDQMRGDFLMRGGKAELNDLSMDGKEVRVTGQGELEPNGSLHGDGVARVARQLITRVMGSVASEILLQQLQKLPFEFLTVRFKLAGTASAPTIKWQIDQKLAQQLVEKALLAGVQRKLTKTIERKIVQIAKLEPSLMPPLLPRESNDRSSPATPPISSANDLERVVLKRTLGRLLRNAIK